MADNVLLTPVEIQAKRIDASLLPSIFSQPYLLYIIQQSTDLGNVAGKANESGEGAFAAQERNDEQDLVLADHEAQLFDHESRITANEGTLANHELRIGVNEVDIDDLQIRMATAESDIDYLLDVAVDHESRISANETELADHESRISDLEDYAYRQKSEVVYSGISLAITTTEVNLLQLLGTLTPTSGSLSPFFDTTTGLMTGLNKDKNLYFKLSIIGTYDNASGNRSMQLVFGTVVPDTIVKTRDAAVSTDNVFFNTFFSVETDDDITDPGIDILIKANGSAFTATQIKIIATQ
ncbi:tail needle knob protein [Vibrio diazotrophicus]|uniref:tail needle knob protein n=1 Tax=Vibrio diazotrophicus TaxID=685 RepID=UPI0015E09F32|nr:tail needle knob protein [Vibrio diazotrophicus]